MLHYSCDLCGCRLDEQRFIVRLEVFPSYDPEAITEEDLERDHLSELSEMLADFEATGEMNLENVEPQSFRYDLCANCHREYRKDPLGRHRPHRMRFSEN